MSSETLIEGRSEDRLLQGTGGAGLQTGPGPREEALQPWQLFTLAGLVGATIVVFVSRGQSPAAVILLSLTIFTAAAVGVAAWRTFSPIADVDEPTGSGVVGGRTRAALEREKALALRTIKELEFDHSMGKVSEKDFADMSQRLRLRAAGLIQQLDAGVGYREQIEREIAKRVEVVGRAVSGPTGEADTPRPPAATAAAAKTCASCQTVNEADARFCKSCGAGLA
jgi:hypothetical protein